MKKNGNFLSIAFACLLAQMTCASAGMCQGPHRERLSIDEGWRFMRYAGEPDSLIYDARPVVTDRNDNKVADTRASEAAVALASTHALKPWILPSANPFIKDPAGRHMRPDGNPGSNFPFVQIDFDDSHWEQVVLPHDWAINGPFYKGEPAVVGGGMGRLPSQGVAWYRRKLEIPYTDWGRSIYLDIDGAMSYAMVWVNGKLVGGWPYGYNSFRLDLTPYLKYGDRNQLAIRLDNPPNSSRWYPGGGIYRHVWIVKTDPVHVGQWGTFVRTRDVTASSAAVDIDVRIDNASGADQLIELRTDVYHAGGTGKKVASFSSASATVGTGKSAVLAGTATIKDPLLWSVTKPNLYVAVTRVYVDKRKVDEYETRFGIRSVVFDPERGVLVNGVPIRIQGVNQHHDLGALGAAFNVRAAERQLQLLRDMGCNAIRLAHNPPAPELLDLTDKIGFLVIDEIFDCWEKGKTPLDFHLIFPDWSEADVRSFVRRDRNHPSVIAWSFGNEVGEQYTADSGAVLARHLHDIVHDEDSTRPATASMNYAKPDMPFPEVMDILCLNYQGEGIRDAPAYAHLKGIRTSPLYPAFHQRFPGKMVVSSETASALSTRGSYIFPVTDGISAPVSDSTGGDPVNKLVSSYELYTAAFGASPDKVFAAQDRNPYVAGEFVWSGWDYLGEPTPYYSSRSSYSGIIDLAGFKKDRYYLYRCRWRPDLPMVHILPHWTWPERAGKVTPVHVFTSGDEAELFLNGRSLGRKKKGPYEYRLRWDSVVYEPGVLKAIAYKDGKTWAKTSVQTAGEATRLFLSADKTPVQADGRDLSFITVWVIDAKGVIVPRADNDITFEISGPGEIVATDNGDPADLRSFASKERKAFNGMALVIVRAKAGQRSLKAQTGAPGKITVIARSKGLVAGRVVIETK
ncbi:MAG TPA: beta-galactosidase GalB [Puia sp.]|nr:beta-galactosidase GalB [Puia sp.]